MPGRSPAAALDREACGRFSAAVSDFVTAQVPLYPRLRKTAEQQRDQAAEAWGVGTRTVDAYKNGERTNLPAGATFRRFCVAAGHGAPDVLAGKILFGPKAATPSTLADGVAAYCDTQLDADIAWRESEPRYRVDGTRALELLVGTLRKATPRAIVVGPMLAHFRATSAGSGYAKAHKELEAFARSVTGDDLESAWRVFREANRD